MHCIFNAIPPRSGDAGEWTESGCQLASVGDEIVCECDHLTNFAILVVGNYCSVPNTYLVLLL